MADKINVSVRYKDAKLGQEKGTAPVTLPAEGVVPLRDVPADALKKVAYAEVICTETEDDDYNIELVLSQEPNLRIALQVGSGTPDFFTGPGSHFASFGLGTDFNNLRVDVRQNGNGKDILIMSDPGQPSTLS